MSDDGCAAQALPVVRACEFQECLAHMSPPKNGGEDLHKTTKEGHQKGGEKQKRLMVADWIQHNEFDPVKEKDRKVSGQKGERSWRGHKRCTLHQQTLGHL